VSEQESIPIKHLALGIAAGFGVVAAVVMIVLFITLLGMDDPHEESPELRAERLKPVGQVQVEGADQAPASESMAAIGPATSAVDKAASPKSGKEVFETVCKACHTPPGVPPAPQLGDKASWGERLDKGEAALIQSALNGIGIMPPKGGADFSDEEVKKAVRYMLESVGAADSSSEASNEAPVSKPEPTEPEAQASSGIDLVAGKQVYDSTCSLCHNMGIAGAPKFGDQALWAARLEKGMDTLVTHAIKGFTSEAGNVMPPKGGRPELSNDEVKNAVAYMLDAVGLEIESKTEDSAPAMSSEKQAEPAAPAEAAVSGPDMVKGEEIYNSACFTCHLTGVAGAPKLGDKALWAPRIAKGMEALYTSVLQGLGVMPPKGGRMDLADQDIKNAVDYMVSKAK
jgi:cytochrome c5